MSLPRGFKITASALFLVWKRQDTKQYDCCSASLSLKLSIFCQCSKMCVCLCVHWEETQSVCVCVWKLIKERESEAVERQREKTVFDKISFAIFFLFYNFQKTTISLIPEISFIFHRWYFYSKTFSRLERKSLKTETLKSTLPCYVFWGDMLVRMW